MPKRGNSSGKWGLIVANPPDRITCLQWSNVNTVFSGNAAGHFLRNWTNARRHDQATHEQGLRVYRHRERQGHVFSLVKPRRGELRRTPRRTTSVVHRRTWTERAKSRKRQAGLTELRGTFVFNHGETDMGDKGSKDKGKKEQQKKAQLSPKEKRKLKKEKKINKYA